MFSNVEMNRKKREVLESVIKNLQFDIKRCDYTIANANQRIEKDQKELKDLQIEE